MNSKMVTLGIGIFAFIILGAILFSGFLFGKAVETNLLDITVAQAYGLILFIGIIYTLFIRKH